MADVPTPDTQALKLKVIQDQQDENTHFNSSPSDRDPGNPTHSLLLSPRYKALMASKSKHTQCWKGTRERERVRRPTWPEIPSDTPSGAEGESFSSPFPGWLTVNQQ